MNPKIKIIAIIILLSFCIFFGLKKVSNLKNEPKNSVIEELKILDYVPKDNKSLFFSNLEISKLIKNFKKESNEEDLDKIILIKDSILGYLGIDLGKNKLKDIYNNELAISTYNNNEKIKDDILIIFKIKQEKKLNDLLNLTKDIDQAEAIIPIYRENKLNYLKFIYRTKDNYIITSSNKKLILNALDLGDNLTKRSNNNSRNIIENFESQKNILLRKKSETNLFFKNKLYPQYDEEIIATTFDYKNKDLISKSYLINNKQNIDISLYQNLINKNTINKIDYQFSIFSDLRSALDYVTNFNEFEKNFLKKLDRNSNQNILFLNSNRDWIMFIERKNQTLSSINDLEEIQPFIIDSIEKNNNIYSIYSKNSLELEENNIKQISYKDIFSVESGEFTAFSNNLNKISDIDLLSKEFVELNENTDDRDFLYQRVFLKNSNPTTPQYFSYLNDLNFLFKNIINFTNEEFIEVIKQSFPEKDPVLYRETKLKLFS